MEELVRLDKLARIGDIMEIRKRIEEIDKLDPKFKPFTAKLQGLAKIFKISEIQQFIQSYLEEGA